MEPVSGDGPVDLPPTDPEDRPLLNVLDDLEERGFTGQFRSLDGARIECLTCRTQLAADEAEVDDLERLEGVSDPADMLAVLALRCPNCATPGTLVVNYGPESTPEDAEVLRAVERGV